MSPSATGRSSSRAKRRSNNTSTGGGVSSDVTNTQLEVLFPSLPIGDVQRSRSRRSRSRGRSVALGEASSEEKSLTVGLEIPLGLDTKTVIRTDYDIYYVLDAILWCTVATLCLYKCVEENNYLYLLVVGFSESKLGLIAHESCHNCSPRFLSLLYDCALGSRLQWIQKHNKQHHLFTNTKDDPDIDASPILRIHPDQPLYWFHKWQWLYQYILFCIIPISLRLNGVLYLLLNGGLLEILLHFILSAPATYLYIIWPIQKYGFLGLKFFFISNAVLGLIYGCLFSVSHINDLVEFDPEGSIVDRQMKSTADWSSGSAFCNYLTGGLNHQVIHHLFPHLPSYALPTLAQELLLAADCNDNFTGQSGVLINNKDKYKVLKGGFLGALRSNAVYLHKMGKQQ